MLDDRYKAPWRKLEANPNATIGQLFALAGGNAATIGFAGGSKSTAGTVRIAGSSSPVAAWGATAMAATRLVKVGSRIFGNLARGSVIGLPQPSPALPTRPQTQRFDISLGATTGRSGVVRSGSVTNPFSVASTVSITSQGLARYLTINGARVGYSMGEFDRVEESRSVPAGGSLAWALVSDGTWAGGDLSFVFSGPDLPPTPAGDPAPRALANAGAAIPFLDLLSTVPWFPSAEAFARAGTWVRRDSWTDPSRQRRFESGLGSSRAVLIENVGGLIAPISIPSFILDDFLAEDWRPVGATHADYLLVDVTDARFEATGLEGFLFLVEAPQVTESDPSDSSGVTPSTPQTDLSYEEMDVTVQEPENEVYPLIQKALYRSRIASFTHALRAGSCEVDLLVNGVSFSEQAIVDAGSKLELQVTATDAAEMLACTIGFVRE